MAFSGDKLIGVGKETHIALFPSSGMGHLTPFLRLASLLLDHHCRVTLITTNPTVSLAESRLVSSFLSSHPQVNQIHFNLLPLDLSTVNSTDPFWIRSESIRRSAHLLSPLLSSLPLSGLISDVMLISSVLPVTEALRLPNYILFTSSARMFSFFAYLPTIASISNAGSAFGEALDIPGIDSPLPISSIPPLILIQNSLFAHIFFSDSSKLSKLDGVLINSFEGLETESLLEALRSRKLMEDLPPVFALGPFEPCGFEKEEEEEDSDSSTEIANWLDEKPDGSVVYVSFGSRTALSKDQTREVGNGLVKSGFNFLWVVKNKQVDKEEEKDDLEDVIGEELMEKIKENGLVVKKWIDQGKILGHKAVAGFVSHCGWNSVVEAAINGVRVLAWPQHGDQKINAEVVEGSGIGMWVKDWGWGGEKVVKGDEIGERVREMMESQSLKVRARDVGEEAKKAVEAGGKREEMFKELIDNLKSKLN